MHYDFRPASMGIVGWWSDVKVGIEIFWLTTFKNLYTSSAISKTALLNG